MLGLPTYRMDLSLCFPEISSRSQSTADADQPIGGLVLALAYLLSGQKFEGSLAQVTMPDVYAEIEEASFKLDIPIDRVFKFAQSLLLPPEATLAEEDMAIGVPYRMNGKGFALHQYQRNVAAWAACRSGTVLALGCGVGKTATATAGAMAAGILGRCSRDRCIIVSPLNAVPEWQDYLGDLRLVFREVRIISVDSTHHLEALPSHIGGALIEDEVHKNKNAGKKRTTWNHSLRRKFDWCAALTGSLLHTGCEGVMSIMDIAVPGLSRYFSKWDFGDAFDAVVMKPARGSGKNLRRTLGYPNEHDREAFASYLSRGVRSLSNESEEVRAELQVPGQTKTTEDLWEAPTWVRELQEEWKNGERAKAAAAGATVTEEDLTLQCPHLWAPDLPWNVYAGALGVALMNEHTDYLRFWLMDNYDIEASEEAEVWEQMHKIIKDCPGDKPLKRMKRFCGLPSFPMLFWHLRVDGNIDRIVSRVKEDSGKATYRFRYAPGSSYDFPAPGVKVQRFLRWCQNNPGEQVVSAAASSATVRMMVEGFKENGWSYGVIDGTTPVAKRKTLVKQFQAKKLRGMLVQQVAGSESMTLTRASNSFLIDHDLQPTAYTQYLARTCRQGQDKECEHFDYAFNSIQMDRIAALRRGERFDSETRKALEASIQYPVLKG